MAIIRSGNPALNDHLFESMSITNNGNAMTRQGTLNKFGFMLLMLLGGAFYTWKEFMEAGNVMPWLITGLIGALICSLVIIFKKEWAGYVAPAYALMEGLLLGAISAMYSHAFEKQAPGIVINAVGLTFGAAIAMYLLYSFKIIKATEKFKSIVMTATVAIGIFYLIAMVLGMFGVRIAMLHEGSVLGIGLSVFVVAIAALNLILDFDRIDQGVEAGAPKYMEWYCAFGLMVTIVWLYLEILRLLAKLSDRK